MKLLLVRHTEAFALGQNGITRDFDRPLTPRGHKTAKRLANFLLELKPRYEMLISSPLVRAIETAEALRPVCEKPKQLMQIVDELAPDVGKPWLVAEVLRRLNPASAILVGHLPDMAELAAWLIGSDTPALEFRKGTACSLEITAAVQPGTASCQWHIPAKIYEAF